jgi:glutaryl-CoA dehydrogenase
MTQTRDFFDIDSALSEEERAIRDTIRRWVDERVLPVIGDCYVEGRFPKELVPEMAELGVFGANLPEQYGCAGRKRCMYSRPRGYMSMRYGCADSRSRRRSTIS